MAEPITDPIALALVEAQEQVDRLVEEHRAQVDRLAEEHRALLARLHAAEQRQAEDRGLVARWQAFAEQISHRMPDSADGDGSFESLVLEWLDAVLRNNERDERSRIEHIEGAASEPRHPFAIDRDSRRATWYVPVDSDLDPVSPHSGWTTLHADADAHTVALDDGTELTVAEARGYADAVRQAADHAEGSEAGRG